MVGQISVFPDVGGAFFGSYRQARGQRLQEAAMRAEMAAAQADRQRQAQARESFARLQGPDQVTAPDRVGQTIGLMGTRLREAGIAIDEPITDAPTQRVVRQGLTPEQRAREEQRYAQADPDGFMAYRQARAQGPEAPQAALENIGRAYVNGDITQEGAIRRLVNYGYTPQQAEAELGLWGLPGEPDQSGWSVREGVINGQPAIVRVNSRTGEVQPVEGVTPTPPSAPRPTGRDQRIASLVQQGFDYNMAANLVDNVVTLESDPVTGQPRLVNVATGEVTPLGEPVSGAEGGGGDGGDSDIPTRTLWESTAGVAGVAGLLTETYGRVAGQLPGVNLGEGVSQIEQNRQMFRTAGNELVRALSNNSRFPVAEQNRIRQEVDILPNPFDSEASLRTRMRSVDNSLRARAQEELRASQDESLPVAQRREASRAYSDITRYLRTMGVPQEGGDETGVGGNEVVWVIRNGRMVRADN